MTECPRRTLHEITSGLNDVARGNIGASGDLGQAAHAVFAEILRTLRRQGESQVPTQEAIEIMRSTLTASRWVLPADEMEDLRWLVLRFAGYKIRSERIMAVEERLEADIVCPDGVTRTLYGTPDLLVADPPDGAVLGDWKTGRGQPKRPRQMPEDGPIVGKQYLSDRGHFQLDCYGLLVMRNFPRIQRTILREAWVRLDEPPHEAVLSREELEHVEFEIGLLMMKLDEALSDGEESGLWYPRPGRHCARKCPVARSCPIPADERGIGALEDAAMAQVEAARYVNVDGLRNSMRDALKAHHEETGAFIPVGDGSFLGWHANARGGRDFKVAVAEGEPVLKRKAAKA